MKTVWIAVALLVASGANAAEVISLRSLQDSTTTTRSVKSLFARSEGIALKAITGASEGLTKYEVSYKGVPVFGHTVIVRVNRDNQVDRLHGYAVRGIDKDVPSVEAQVSENDAVLNARKHHEMVQTRKDLVYRDLKSGLYIFVDDAQTAHLSYMVTFFSDTIVPGSPSRPVVFVDANTGAVLRYNNQLTHELVNATGPGGNKKTGQYNYNSIVVDKVGAKCTMDTGDLMTVDLNHQGNADDPEAPLNDNTPFSFNCSNNTYKAIGEAYCPINDAHINGNGVLAMYKEWFGASPLKVKLKMRVHFAKDYENAFWDGKAMTFGDGGTNLYPLSTALDVTAHEVSHGFTEFNANLEYRTESGGINEAFSDMAGEATEYFVRGKNDWLVGAEIMKSQEALRYFADPTKDKMSLDNVAKFKWPAQCDTLMNATDIFSQMIYIYTCSDMHFSSGIYNKAYYLMATANGSDPRKAFAVFHRANQNYWSAKTNFVDGAKGVKDAASDLGFDQQIVIDAFKAVGINI